ncbi:hypothetical protein [Edaphovirga cremea]|uniref:hypothetical protein n=1 Tax=Edaphovirga cremea TaxID=2267246 RepID=UPI001475420C|nr:hypothetical protein [Edaphovirga cremea]
MGQRITGMKPGFPGESHRFFVLLQRNGVHAFKTDNFCIHQRFFIGERSRVDARPEGNFVVMDFQLTPVLRAKCFRCQLNG